jgi:hypothetical protein
VKRSFLAVLAVVVGAGSVVAGVYLTFGLGVALVVAGLALVGAGLLFDVDG